ncbi:MAG: endospore germination permease [Clostridiales bacterium]|nr:endospore germination permease [Clostridiales bacterium]
MRVDKGLITGNQFMFSIICFIQSSSLLTSFLTSVTLQDSWLIVIFGAIFFIPVIFIYREIMLLFPDKNLIQILDEVYGPILGKVFGIIYIWFFLSLTSLNVLDLGDFTKLTIMHETPSVVLMIMCVLVASIAVRHGIGLVTKYSTFFSVTVSCLLIISVLLLLNQIKLENFLPILSLPFKKYVQGTHLITTIPFGELLVFLMIHPSVKLNRKQATKYLFWGFGLGTVSILVVLCQNIAVLGNMLDMFALPTLVTLRLINLGEALSRMEVLFSVILIMLLFFKISVLYYVSVLAVSQMFNTNQLRYLSLAAGALIVCYALTLYPSPVEHAESAKNITPFVWTPIEFLIPLLTLILGKFKKRKQLKEA